MHDDEDEHDGPRLPAGTKNYMTPAGHARLRAELHALSRVERPQVVEIVSWAAGNGDRSENGDYLYGKKRLREIDRRIRFLGKRLEIAEVVDPAAQTNRGQVFFGATVTYVNERDEERTVTVLGVDEADITRGEVSLHSPIARTLLRRRVGDTARLQTPQGIEEIEILAIAYPEPE
jgi:transcription elongation factor GreB